MRSKGSVLLEVINRLTSPATSIIGWCSSRGMPEDGWKMVRFVFVFVDRFGVGDIICAKCPSISSPGPVTKPKLFISWRAAIPS